MPVLSSGTINIDYTDDGEGHVVVLVHSSVSGNRQWGLLTSLLKQHYRVIAINLYGYGETTSWPDTTPQSLYAQAQLFVSVCKDMPDQISLVGHFFGGSVALKTAMLMGAKIKNLVLLEPNPFFCCHKLAVLNPTWKLECCAIK